MEPWCEIFPAALQSQGRLARKGQRVDATFVEVARPRHSREDHAKIQAGERPAGGKDHPQQARQKEGDARWTKKKGERYCGDKNPVKVDRRSQLIADFTVTAASVHDSHALEERLAQGDPTTDGDSASTGARCAQIFAERKVPAKPMERACRNKPLNGSQQRNNRARSKIRVRVEHAFATLRRRLRSAWNRCLGLSRNRALIALTNLVYPMGRFEQSERLGRKNWRAA